MRAGRLGREAAARRRRRHVPYSARQLGALEAVRRLAIRGRTAAAAASTAAAAGTTAAAAAAAARRGHAGRRAPAGMRLRMDGSTNWR